MPHFNVTTTYNNYIQHGWEKHVHIPVEYVHKTAYNEYL
jgi:hypothetical protein